MKQAGMHHKQPEIGSDRQGRGAAVASLHDPQVAQLKAMIEGSHPVTGLAQLAAMVDASPRVAAQKNFAESIGNSPYATAQRKYLRHLSDDGSRWSGGETVLQLQSPRLSAQGDSIMSSRREVFQLASKVDCTSLSYSYNNGGATAIVGRSMKAELDPDSPINGSAPGEGEQAGLMGYLKDTKTFKSMKRGHLMNGQLGGPGIAANLHPLTTQANNHHKSYVENYVKQAIANDLGVLYTVNVNSDYDADGVNNAAAEFRCESWVWDPKGNVIDLVSPQPFAAATITSRPQAGSTGTGDIAPNVNPKLTFLTKDLPKGWGEKKKGLQEWNGKIPSHFSSTHL